MKIYIIFYTFYKINIKIKFKTKNITKIKIIVKKKFTIYFKIKKTLFYDFKNENLIIINHNCKFLNLNHSFKHLLKINHNSILENKINGIF